jgi:predicted nicotinamide N-methyase
LDVSAFIRENLTLEPVPGLEDILVYRAHSASRLSRLALSGGNDRPPYWAYLWSGGLALAHYIRQYPQNVQGKRILDIGSGSGLLGLVAAREGAETVLCADIDPHACAAIQLNAAANRVRVEVTSADLFQQDLPQVDIVLMGDLFYSADIAEAALAFARKGVSAGMDVIVGDPGRENLPSSHLQQLASYAVSECGMTRDLQSTQSSVFRFG